MTDFERGYEAACNFGEHIAAQCTCDEALHAGGPDFLAGQGTDEPPAWHRGWDAAIMHDRNCQPTE